MTTKPTYEELEKKIKELEKKAVEHNQAEDVLWTSEEKWRSLAETAPCVILMVQRDGTIQFLNRTIGKYTPENTIGTKVWDYVPPDHHSVMRKAIEHVFQTGLSIGYEILGAGLEGPASAWYMTQLGPIFRDGRVVAVTMASTDITEIKKAHEALRESEAQKKAILDASVDRIRLSDTDMRIIWANQTHERELNIHPEELIGQQCYSVFVKRDTPCPECPSIKAIKSGQIEHTVLARPSIKNQEKITYLDSYAVPLKNESGAIESLIQITRNITEQVQAEKALREREEELKIKATNLKEVITALRVLLKRRDEDKTELEEKVLSNVKELVVPFLAKVKKTPLDSKQFTYIDILESNLNDITAPFLHNLSTKY
ncbi:MAG: PAS domain-containing protein, partial [Deltaproteobacteria bacterium]|nr:PAS domain-containing protein [Deltaproteobacteria bacterium]